MSIQVTFSLPNEVYQYVRYVADLSGHTLDEFIVDRLEQVLPPLLSEMDTRPVETLSDDEIKHLVQGTKFKAQTARLNVLLQKQEKSFLTAMEHAEVSLLSDFYEAGQKRMAEAKSEATKRDLGKFS